MKWFPKFMVRPHSFHTNFAITLQYKICMVCPCHKNLLLHLEIILMTLVQRFGTIVIFAEAFVVIWVGRTIGTFHLHYTSPTAVTLDNAIRCCSYFWVVRVDYQSWASERHVQMSCCSIQFIILEGLFLMCATPRSGSWCKANLLRIAYRSQETRGWFISGGPTCRFHARRSNASSTIVKP